MPRLMCHPRVVTKLSSCTVMYCAYYQSCFHQELLICSFYFICC